ncbi:MAG: dihydrofolate synthase / folylpolyglutamate synthase, partial [Chloroflexota bacterium]|nr:dihydrofolate synthase / folylpolyglutamate synthase [Chloroflexota bacterium]
MPPSYRESLDWLTATGSRGIRPGLERVSALLDALGNPQEGLRGALVAGTNGKGSVCAMVESACRAAGLSTVMLVKPHLRSYRERVVIDGQPVSPDGFARLVDRVRPVVEAVEPEVGAPTQFEILTALGILAAADRRPDVVVCEVGLGGRLDSTNVLDL